MLLWKLFFIWPRCINQIFFTKGVKDETYLD